MMNAGEYLEKYLNVIVKVGIIYVVILSVLTFILFVINKL